MNKTKQEILELVDAAENVLIAYGMGWDIEGVIQVLREKATEELRTLITESVILSDGEIEGMRKPETTTDINKPMGRLGYNDAVSHNAALDKIKEMK